MRFAIILLPFISFSLGIIHFSTNSIKENKTYQADAKTIFYQSVEWSPDGKQICFSAIIIDSGKFDGKKWDIYSMNADGSNLKKLTNNNSADLWPSWSPNGKKIVFESERDEAQPEIYKMNADGSDPVRLTINGFRDVSPAWSPDGKWIAFISDRDGNPELYRMNTDGSGQKRLTNSVYKEYNPCWSPDSKYIVYYYEKGDSHDQVSVTSTDGLYTIRITSDTLNNTYPGWSHDGKIHFQETGKNIKRMVYAQVNNKSLKKETFNLEGNFEEVKVEGFFSRYSPDGKKIASINGGWPKSEIAVTNEDGSGKQIISNKEEILKQNN